MMTQSPVIDQIRERDLELSSSTVELSLLIARSCRKSLKSFELLN